MKRPDLWALAGITLLIVVAYRELWTGTAAIRFDADDLFAPYFLLIADHVRQGRLLLWDPWTFAGVPVTAYPELGSFSPLVCLFGLVGGAHLGTFVAYCFLLIWLGAAGMYVLTRSLGVPVVGAFLAGIAYLFSGYGVGHLQHTSWFCTFVFLPWTIWRIDVALRTNRLSPALQGGALWGLSGLAGYPGMILVGGLIAALWTATSPRSHGHVASRAKIFGVWFATGVLVLAPAYLGFFTETRGYSDRRSELPYEIAVNENALDPAGLLTFASPHPAIWLLFDRKWLPTDPSSVSIYVAPTVLWLAILAMIFGDRDPRRWGLAGIAVLGLALAVGDVLPIRGWFYYAVLPSRFFRHSSLFSSMATFAVCVLAGLGSGDLLRSTLESAKRRRFVGIATALALIAAAAFALTRLVDSKGSLEGIPGTTLAMGHFVVVWLGLVPLAVLAGARDRGVAFAVVAVVVASIDVLLQTSICRPILLDENLMRLWREQAPLAQHGLDLTRNNGVDRSLDHRLGSFTNDKHILLRFPMLWGYGSLRNRHFEGLVETEKLRDFALGKDRFWFAKEPVRCPPTDKNFKAFVARCKETNGIAAVIHAPDAMRPELPDDVDASASIASAEKATRVPIELLAYDPTELRFRVKVSEPGWVIVTDRWSAGWQATVNGQPTETWGGIFAFRAVEVPRGISEVAFAYRPFGNPWLMVLSWAILAGTAVGCILGFVGPFARAEGTRGDVLLLPHGAGEVS
ncbi:MAG TPA: hypothetical protein VHR72_12885 [Gemmataceae bacterium]|nr:hypothetical protein [Gemmataceae bacterium]